jgi:hypothetical protein
MRFIEEGVYPKHFGKKRGEKGFIQSERGRGKNAMDGFGAGLGSTFRFRGRHLV